MSDKDIIFLSAAVAAVLADGLNADECDTLSNFITCVGDDLAAAAGQKDIEEKKMQGIERQIGNAKNAKFNGNNQNTK
jgi:hypothetical protein